MREVARVRAEEAELRWVILHETEDGTYVFPCATEEDGSGTGDYWFLSRADAHAACAEHYGVRTADWIEIDDPPPGCQQDWICPVRVPGRETGKPEWGTLERLIEGRWERIQLGEPRPTIEWAIQQALARIERRNAPDSRG